MDVLFLGRGGGRSEKNRFFENVGDFLVANHSGTFWCRWKWIFMNSEEFCLWLLWTHFLIIRRDDECIHSQESLAVFECSRFIWLYIIIWSSYTMVYLIWIDSDKAFHSSCFIACLFPLIKTWIIVSKLIASWTNDSLGGRLLYHLEFARWTAKENS